MIERFMLLSGKLQIYFLPLSSKPSLKLMNDLRALGPPVVTIKLVEKLTDFLLVATYFKPIEGLMNTLVLSNSVKSSIMPPETARNGTISCALKLYLISR